MKILEINKFHFIKGGGAKHFLDVTRLLRRHGHDVAVFSMQHSQNQPSQFSRYFPSYVGYNPGDPLFAKLKGLGRLFYSFEARRKIKQLLRDFQPEIVHIHNIYRQLSPSILKEIKKHQLPVVMTVHDFKLIYPDQLPPMAHRRFNEDRRFFYFNFIRHKCFKHSYFKSFLAAAETLFARWTRSYDPYIDLYLTPTAWTKQVLVTNGIDPQKIKVLPLPLVAENPTSAEAKPIPQPAEKYFFHHGRLSRAKGTDELIKIFQKNPQLNLYLAGTLYDQLKIPAAPNIKYLGFLPPQLINQYIQHSLAVVSPSRVMETLGLVILEAHAQGKPFIGLDAGAYAESVKNNQNGLILENLNQLEKTLIQIDQGKIQFDRPAVIQEAMLKKHNPQKYYQQLIDIFSSLIPQKS